MTSQDVPRNPATKDPIQISMGMALSTPALPRTTPVSFLHPKRGRGHPQARTFSVAKHINATTVSAPAKRFNRPPISRPTKPQHLYQHRLAPTLFQPTFPPPALLCSETPSRFSTPGDNLLLSLLNPVPYPSAGHSAHTRPCENTAAHPTTPHHICTACCATALANIRSTPLLRLHNQRHSRRWPFVLPLCGACSASARAHHPSPAGYDGCGCVWRILGRWICFACRVGELEKAGARWEAEREARRGFVRKGVGDGKELVGWLGILCVCGDVVEGGDGGVKAGRCAGCEGVVVWGRGGGNA